MVNYGVSRACETCRKRRKKCDEGRPACRRCIKAGRVCLGYRSYEDLRFRHHTAPVIVPVQSPSPPICQIPIAQDPVAFFLDQYVVISTNTRLSRGFLDGLPSLLDKTHPSSNLVQAVQIVAWATVGNRLDRPDLLENARKQYVSILSSFQSLLQYCQLGEPPMEALVIAILLGLYEIVSNGEPLSGQQKHVAHVRGVCALLLNPNSPFDLFSSTQLFQVANPLLIKRIVHNDNSPGVLCAPAFNNTVQNLDSILIQCHPLFERANTQLQNPEATLHELQRALGDALAIDFAFSHWYTNQDATWKPNIVGHIAQKDAESSSCSFAWAGKVHSYFDIYVVAVMNTYRKTYLMLLDILISLSTDKWHTSDRYYDKMGATGAYHNQRYNRVDSIPPHNVHDYEQMIRSSNGSPHTGRAVGGLLLLHPLFVLATCSIVPSPIHTYVTKCLAWIGENMGIGQAKLMSKGYTSLPFQEMAEGHVLIWAGMLLHTVDMQRELLQ